MLAHGIGRMTGKPEFCVTGKESSRHGPEVGFEDIVVDLPQERFWTVQKAEADNYGCPNYATSHFELISL
jgi:hypothetical protein